MTEKERKSSRIVVSYKIAAFVIIMLFAPITVAAVLHQPPNPGAQAASLKANDMANYQYQLNIPQAGQKVVCIVFDDGWQTQYTDALPILNYYGYKASFAIITSYVGTSWGSSEGLSYMTWNEIVTLADHGNDIESHTYSHPDLATLSSASILYQIAESKQDLEDHGINAPILVYPDGGGAGNATVESLTQQYYVAARGINPVSLNMSQPFDRYDLPAYTMENTTTINDFENIVNSANNSSVVILYYHKIDYENVDTAITPQEFTAQMQYLHDNSFTVETMKQLFTATS
ncbi:MAG: polysaccharide deacetylase family protein [Candidatus Bathyarchaeia archaeon]|jgi:peptidoglycan/xylan/chitin deacetylase (PgdA/CDA1 family)